MIASKSDLPNFKKKYATFKNHHPQLKIVPFSAKTLDNLNVLKREMHYEFAHSPKIPKNFTEVFDTITLSKEEIIVRQIASHVFEVSGHSVVKLYNKIPLTTHQNIMRFKKQLEGIGVWRILVKQKVKPGDKIQILGYHFFW